MPDVFSPCAGRYQVTGPVLQTLLANTSKATVKPFIICGANNVYDTAESFRQAAQSVIAIGHYDRSGMGKQLWERFAVYGIA